MIKKVKRTTGWTLVGLLILTGLAALGGFTLEGAKVIAICLGALVGIAGLMVLILYLLGVWEKE